MASISVCRFCKKIYTGSGNHGCELELTYYELVRQKTKEAIGEEKTKEIEEAAWKEIRPIIEKTLQEEIKQIAERTLNLHHRYTT